MSELNKLEQYIISKKDKIQISSKDIKSGDIFLALKGKRFHGNKFISEAINKGCLLYTSPSPRDRQKSRMPSSA